MGCGAIAVGDVCFLFAYPWIYKSTEWGGYWGRYALFASYIFVANTLTADDIIISPNTKAKLQIVLGN